MDTSRTEWKTGKVLVLILLIFVLLVVVRDAKLASLHKAAIPEAVDIFKKQCLQIGIASWYGKDKSGRHTASGERYDPRALTAAHRKYPFGTKLNVINLENERNVTVTVNDRGPYLNNRIVDLSMEAAHQLGMKKPGLVAVCVQNATKSGGAEAGSEAQ